MQPQGDKLDVSCNSIKAIITALPSTAVILGSGLGDLGDAVTVHAAISTTSIPHYPVSTVPGHKGKLLFGAVGKTTVLIFQGRVHYYESGDTEAVLYPIRVAHQLGISNLVVTNAAGAVASRFNAGDLMLITDQINLINLGATQVKEPHGGSSSLYSKRLIDQMTGIASAAGIMLQKGVYTGVRGPSYETAAEVEMVRRIGGHAVGMSTVLEVELAASYGMQVLGLSCITNQATGLGGSKLSHQDVIAIPPGVKKNFTTLLLKLLAQLS